MRPLRWLLDWLAVRPQPDRTRGRLDPDPLDIERIKQEMALQAEARRLGHANVPPTGAVEITAVESQIVRLVDRARQDYVGWAQARLDVLNQTIAEIDLDALAKRVSMAAAVYEQRASALLESRAPALKGLASGLRSARAELGVFRSRHGLGREARYPAPSLRVFLVFSLCALVVGEAFLNAFFFAAGMDSGILGGWVHAGAFSLVNVLGGYAWGRYLIPYANHVSWRLKLAGCAGIAAAIATAVGVGLLLAHFRDAVSHEPANAARVALETFLARPFGLLEFQSFVLFGVSVLFALLAALDAYHLDDPYPQYGRASRRVARAAEDYEEELEDARGALDALKEESLDELRSALDQAERRIHRLHEAIAHKLSTENRLANALRDAANCLDALLRYFRDENRVVRQSAAPAYFDTTPQLAAIDTPDFDTTLDRERLDEHRARLARMLDEASAAKMAILAAFSRRHRMIKPLEDHFSAALRAEAYEAAGA
jgi:hypothetical protein